MSETADHTSALTAYFESRRVARLADAERKFARLGKRTQRLVREAAVMGYVQGHRAHMHEVPPDSDILLGVLTAVDSFPDLYPTLSRL